MAETLFEIAVILIATKSGGIAARRMRMPEVLGALIAGVLLGPAVLNIAAYGSGIKLLAQIGVVMLMFMAGLETDLDRLKKAGLSSFVIASFGIAVPLVLGTLAAFIFYKNIWENIFIGVILTATSVSITVETLTELGKLNTRAGANILGAAVIDDILGLILISVVLALSGKSGEGSPQLAFRLLGILAFCAAALAAIIWLPKYVNKLLRHFQTGRTFFTLSLAAALLAAFISEYVGIAAITGAYLCGLLMSRFDHRETVERGLKSVSSAFLAPIFFASVGLEANFKGFTYSAFLITIFMFAVAVIGKIIGCGGAARLLHLSRAEALQVGVGMVSRGEVAIITANIGLQNGIISEVVFLPTVAVVILTTVAAPVMLRFAFSHRFEKKLTE